MGFFDFLKTKHVQSQVDEKLDGNDSLNYKHLDKIFIQKSVTDNVNGDVINKIKNYLIAFLEKDPASQFYIIHKPMVLETSENKYNYEYENDVLVLLSSNHFIIFIDLLGDKNRFENYIDEFIEDIGSISREYSYIDTLGRPKIWRDTLIKRISLSEVEDCINSSGIIQIGKREDIRKIELLISLLVGSINDSKRVGGEYPKTILEIIRKNIILFDAEQTRFIYNTGDKKVVKIQGLAGTGKTELLLHKLKDIYVKDDESKIFFTCHNKILATDLKNRIPTFFNFMKVKKQIDWENRLFVGNAWGSLGKEKSGLYVYLCHFYKFPFHRYSNNVGYKEIFSELLLNLQDKKKSEDFEFALDYILIDESQDFPQEFFEVCKLVSSKQVYIAGDVFQDIFETDIEEKVADVDFVLNKCYRTDPKTLMFAHSIGMGLFEKQKLNFLFDDEWEKCGYIVNKKDDKLSLTREPMKRFNDLEIKNSIELFDVDNVKENVMNILGDVVKNYSDVKPEDIAIIFLDNNKEVYADIDILENLIISKYAWEVNKAHETKNKQRKGIFLSNSNNVKGLEFPFVICVSSKLDSTRYNRNKIYTMLTRSFLKSYLIFSKKSNLIEDNKKGLQIINDELCILTDYLGDEVIKKIKQTTIKSKNIKGLDEMVEGVIKKLNINAVMEIKLKKDCVDFFSNKEYSEDIIIEYITNNIKYY